MHIRSNFVQENEELWIHFSSFTSFGDRPVGCTSFAKMGFAPPDHHPFCLFGYSRLQLKPMLMPPPMTMIFCKIKEPYVFLNSPTFMAGLTGCYIVATNQPSIVLRGLIWCNDNSDWLLAHMLIVPCLFCHSWTKATVGY